MEKPCIEVIAHFNLDGIIIPLRIRMIVDNEEVTYGVHHPSKPVKRASLKIGVQGDRYACKIAGKNAYLFRDQDNKWFIEIM